MVGFLKGEMGFVVSSVCMLEDIYVKKFFIIGIVFVGLVFFVVVFVVDIKLVVFYDLGGCFDKFFNEVVYMGVEKFKIDIGIEYWDFEI